MRWASKMKPRLRAEGEGQTEVPLLRVSAGLTGQWKWPVCLSSLCLTDGTRYAVADMTLKMARLPVPSGTGSLQTGQWKRSIFLSFENMKDGSEKDGTYWHDPQPDNVVCIHRTYTKLARAPTYISTSRITIPYIHCVEYLSFPKLVQPHGNAYSSGAEYVRTRSEARTSWFSR